MTDPREEKFLDVREVAARYDGKVSVKTFNNMRTKGGGPRYVKIGGRVLYRLSDVVAWENSRTAWGTSEQASR